MHSRSAQEFFYERCDCYHVHLAESLKSNKGYANSIQNIASATFPAAQLKTTFSSWAWHTMQQSGRYLGGSKLGAKYYSPYSSHWSQLHIQVVIWLGPDCFGTHKMFLSNVLLAQMYIRIDILHTLSLMFWLSRGLPQELVFAACITVIMHIIYSNHYSMNLIIWQFVGWCIVFSQLKAGL